MQNYTVQLGMSELSGDVVVLCMHVCVCVYNTLVRFVQCVVGGGCVHVGAVFCIRVSCMSEVCANVPGTNFDTLNNIRSGTYCNHL